jgi:hypothetical protein
MKKGLIAQIRRFFCRRDACKADVDEILDEIRQEFDTPDLMEADAEWVNHKSVELFLLESSGRFDFPGLSYPLGNAIGLFRTDSTL